MIDDESVYESVSSFVKDKKKIIDVLMNLAKCSWYSFMFLRFWEFDSEKLRKNGN